MAEISLLIDAIILSLYLVALVGGGTVDPSMRISTFAAIVAAINVVVAIIALLKSREKSLFLWSAASYGLLALTIATLIFTSGGIASPYVALWILVAAFAGLYGVPGLLALALLVNGYIVWQLLDPPAGLTSSRLMMFALASDLPLVVSYIIWHKKNQSERKKDQAMSQLAKELSEVANKSEIVINAIADGVIAVNAEGTIQLLNPAAQTLLGWGKQEAIGLDYALVMKLTSKQDQPISDGQNPVEQVKITKQPIINNELTLTSKTGKKMVTSLVVSPLLNEQRQVVGMIIVFRDITAETKAQREQAEFISTASHEMRTPVAAIEGYLGLVLNPQTASIDDKARAYLLKAKEAVQHLGRLFQDLLTVSKAEDGRLQQHPQTTNLVAFTANIIDGLQPKAKEKGLRLRFAAIGKDDVNGQKRLSPVYYAHVDRDHLREVIGNLIENAIKYTKQGEIVVDLEGDDKHVTISVKDSGIGIPREDIPHLFQKFYRVDSSDTREIGGTGLGLYICRRLIESMRGRISVQSELGQGSTFLVTLPRLSGAQVRQLQDSEAIEALQGDAAKPAPFFGQTAAPQFAVPPSAPATNPVRPVMDVAPQPAPSPPQIGTPPPPTPVPPAQAQPVATPPVTSTPAQRRAPTISELQAQWHAKHGSQPPVQDVYQAAPTAANSSVNRGSIAVPQRSTNPILQKRT